MAKSRIGYTVAMDTANEYDGEAIKGYIDSEYGLTAEVTVGYDADEDGEFDDILLTFDPADESAAEAALADIAAYIKGAGELPTPSPEFEEMDLAIKKKLDKDGKEK